MNKLILEYISRLVVLLVALPVHECAHAWASYKLGDPTAKLQGRLTLNPAAHLDLMGTICMLVCGIGWAKPVPIDVRYYHDRKKGMALSALAGPVSNMLMALVGMLFYKVFVWCNVYWVVHHGSESAVLEFLYVLFHFICAINISLGIFNLMPVPPFDGSRIMLLFLPEKVYFKIMQYEQYIFVGVFLLLWLNVLDIPLSIANNFIFGLMDKATGFIDSIALSFAG